MSLTGPLDPLDSDWQSQVWRLLGEVNDPEIPVLSILDLGIVRYVRGATREALHVGLTSTYSGCPASEIIQRSVEEKLARAGYSGAVGGERIESQAALRRGACRLSALQECRDAPGKRIRLHDLQGALHVHRVP